MNITAVRHGQTNENAANIIQGQALGTLSPEGIEQTKQLGKRLADERFDAVYCSDLQRCKDTAAAIAAHHPDMRIVYDARLRERSMRPDEGRTFDELGWDYEDSHHLGRKTAEGESWLEVRARLVPFIEELKERHAGQRILLVTHGGPLRVLDSILGDQPLAEAIRNFYDNCAVREWTVADRLTITEPEPAADPR